MKYLLLSLLLLSLNGCFQYNIFGHQIPADNHTNWYKYWYEKDGSSSEIIKAMLECGFDSPRGNASPLSGLCMKKSGFKNKKLRFCQPIISSGGENIQFANCHLQIEDIPERNVTKRLNSGWCKSERFRNYEYCLP